MSVYLVNVICAVVVNGRECGELAGDVRRDHPDYAGEIARVALRHAKPAHGTDHPNVKLRDGLMIPDAPI